MKWINFTSFFSNKFDQSPFTLERYLCNLSSVIRNGAERIIQGYVDVPDDLSNEGNYVQIKASISNLMRIYCYFLE